MTFDKDALYDFLHRTDFAEQTRGDFESNNFLYDHNEVQELYFNPAHNYDLYLTGITGLNKTKMLQGVLSDLIKSGVSRQNIIYADFELPFIREMSIEEIIEFFPKQNNNNLYLIINEIGLRENFFTEVRKKREHHPNVKLLASCSVPFLIYEQLQDVPDDLSKVIVLSPKNESNIKSESETFGVYGHLKYNIKNGICEIKGLTKDGKEHFKHVIPPEINGCPVKIIASGAFHHRSNLTEIEIPDTVVYIGDYAFTKCDSLTKIKLPKKLTHVGDCAFLGAKKLKTIIGGNNIEHIGCSALYATEWLTNQTDDYVVLGRVLYQYKGLNNKVILPKGVFVLGSYAFRNTNIAEIDLAEIENIEEGCFFGCENLTVVKNHTNEHIPAFMFYNCRSLCIYGGKIKFAAKYAFYNCRTLREITFDKADIGAGAFEKCEGLINVYGNIRSAGTSSFYGASTTQIDLRSAKKIGDCAFMGSQLNELILMNAEEIGRHAFADLSQLKEVSIQTNAEIREKIFLGSVSITRAELSGKYPLKYYFNDRPPIEKLTVNGDCCDNFCSYNDTLKEVSILNGRIGNWAFYYNTNLNNVNMLKCKSIGAWAFAYCDRLRNVMIPESVTYIEMNAFRYCRKLFEIELQSTEPIMFGANAFYSTAMDKRFFVKNVEPYFNIPIWREYLPNLTIRGKQKETGQRKN